MSAPGNTKMTSNIFIKTVVPCLHAWLSRYGEVCRQGLQVCVDWFRSRAGGGGHVKREVAFPIVIAKLQCIF